MKLESRFTDMKKKQTVHTQFDGTLEEWLEVVKTIEVHI